MSLSKTLSFCFSPSVRDRGALYFTSGKVKIQDAQDGLVLARVQGTRSYGIGLAREGTTLFGFCDCVFFVRNRLLCKHIWSVILATEARGKPDWIAQGVQNIVPDEEPDEADEEDEGAADGAPRPRPQRRDTRVSTARSPSWKLELAQIKARLGGAAADPSPDWPAQRKVYYLLRFKDQDDEWMDQASGLEVEITFCDPLAKGGFSKPRFRKTGVQQLSSQAQSPDREILSLLCGPPVSTPGHPIGVQPVLASKVRLLGGQLTALLPQMCATGRCLLADQEPSETARGLEWDAGGAWDFQLDLSAADASGNHTLSASLRREGEALALPHAGLKAAAGLVCVQGRLSRLADARAEAWLRLAQDKGRLELPDGQVEDFLRAFFDQAWIPGIKLPENLDVRVQAPEPRLCLTIQGPRERSSATPYLMAEVSFGYGAVKVLLGTPQQYLYQPKERLLLRRDAARETRARARLAELNFAPVQTFNGAGRELMQIPSKDLALAVRELVSEHWNVEAQGRVFRQASRVRVDVSSGVDWFDVSLGAEFEGQRPALPELLAALRRKDGLVNLSDGSVGVLPAEWLERYGFLAGLGEEKEGKLRFKRSQAGLLDLLLAERDGAQVAVDAGFKRALKEILNFEKLDAVQEPGTFIGELRPYQREGLAWMLFLQRSGFGGCLADDMGLGKTVQVLALLETRRTQKGRAKRPPSLLVVPKSLVFNWQDEAARFTPGLRILAHVGQDRAKDPQQLKRGCDVVLTTYGTLRQDILLFKDLEFDYLVLDESQAAKNAGSDTAKAVRLLKGAHRLALSGTPVENHLGELWSLLEFLNPGLLGPASAFKPATADGGGTQPETLHLLARALRPFILRRTKDKVAKELPAKLEKTLVCELEPEQRRLYLELRDHYRESLLKRVERDGLAKSKLWVLEALLRLRQAACHPGLVDKSKLSAPCAKLETLLPRLQEVMDEGHKALVFSQFTSFLEILRGHLDRSNIVYEYLDGKTKDRAGCVERFQTDPDRKLFLISLKAGGVGLNLTAAEYVFLLDPWWNPAVEAQALDRAHRIGQTRQVFAYRLIAKDTVEEKVLQLQETKRRLADGILNADESVMGRLTRSDLEALFS